MLLLLLLALLLLLGAAVGLAGLVGAAGLVAAAGGTAGGTTTGSHFIFKVAILFGGQAGVKVDERGRHHRGLYDDRSSPSTHSAS